MERIAPRDLLDHPGLLDARLRLPSGEHFASRLLRREDGPLLGAYFRDLQPATRRLYGPHPLTWEEGEKICAALDQRTLRFVALPAEEDRIIAYFILELGVRPADLRHYQERAQVLDEAGDCTLAPSVADAWQSRGLGSALLPAVLEAARRLGRRRVVLWGGTRSDNPRAIHFYEKFGFRRMGDFHASGIANHDMVLDL